MSRETWLANTIGKDAADIAMAATLRAAQDGESVRIDMFAGLVEALSAADARRFCAALGLWYPLAKSAVAVSHTGDTNEFTLATIAIPAGAMGPSGALRVTSVWSHTSSGNNKTLRYRLGGVSGQQYMAAVNTTVASLMTQRLIQNRNSQASQVSSAQAIANAFGTSGGSPVTSTVDMSAAQDLVISGHLASAGETIALESYLVELAYGA
jgi:hypothetical protein